MIPLAGRQSIGKGSDPCSALVKAFLARPIEGDWPYLWIDATYVKVRQNGRIVSVAVTAISAPRRRPFDRRRALRAIQNR